MFKETVRYTDEQLEKILVNNGAGWRLDFMDETANTVKFMRANYSISDLVGDEYELYRVYTLCYSIQARLAKNTLALIAGFALTIGLLIGGVL